MLITGDILATLGTFFGVAVTSWATILIFKLLFPARAAKAAVSLTQNPWVPTAVGTMALVFFGGLALGMMGSKIPLLILAGMVMLGWMLAIALVGAAGIATLLAERIEEMGSGLSSFAGQSRAAALLVGVCLLPFAGWFVFAPALLAVTLGAGISVVFGRDGRRVRA